jgi:hypothetical protein
MHAWVAMQVETKFLWLFRQVAIGDWIGGWDKCRLLFVVMVERPKPSGRCDRPGALPRRKIDRGEAHDLS